MNICYLKREKTWKDRIEKREDFWKRKTKKTSFWKIKETDEWDNSISLKQVYLTMKLKIYYNHIIEMNNNN